MHHIKTKFALGIIIGIIVVSLIGSFSLRDSKNDSQKSSSPANGQSQSQNKQNVQSAFDKKQYSLTDPTSPWVVVNKKRALPKGYAPADLVSPAVKLRLSPDQEQMHARKLIEPALIDMFTAAKRDGVTLVFGSGYRSEKLQTEFYNQYVAQSGQAAADKFSARPGHSEHQTGLALDVSTANGKCHLEICFADTPEGKWIVQHGHEYGFVIRYMQGKESITGYQFEPWHIRYVGKELATELHKNNATLEEFFDLGPADQY
jgi:D-alanyl-D-alanine carboxypeptidase